MGMQRLRTRIGWLLGGGERTQAALDEHAEAIRDLQRALAEGTDVESIRDRLREAVDDLGDRIAALEQRIARIERGEP
jgi:uncharacterized small protein (DUF1192 family)